jgi:hypothetical protein
LIIAIDCLHFRRPFSLHISFFHRHADYAIEAATADIALRHYIDIFAIDADCHFQLPIIFAITDIDISHISSTPQPLRHFH